MLNVSESNQKSRLPKFASLQILLELDQSFPACTAYKVSLFGVILVNIFRHFPTFGLNTVYLSIFNPNVGKCGKNADQNNSKCGHFFPAWCSCILNWFPVICQSALFPLSWVNRVNSFWSWIDQNLERKKIWTEIKSGGSQWFQKVTLTYSWIMLKHDQTGIENLVVWTPQDFKERSKDISLYVTVHWLLIYQVLY